MAPRLHCFLLHPTQVLFSFVAYPGHLHLLLQSQLGFKILETSNRLTTTLINTFLKHHGLIIFHHLSRAQMIATIQYNIPI